MSQTSVIDHNEVSKDVSSNQGDDPLPSQVCTDDEVEIDGREACAWKAKARWKLLLHLRSAGRKDLDGPYWLDLKLLKGCGVHCTYACAGVYQSLPANRSRDWEALPLEVICESWVNRDLDCEKGT